MSTKGWAPERQAAAATLIAAGWTPAMTAAALGVSAQTAQTWARRERLPPPTDPRARRAIALRLHEHAWTFARIAARLGVSVKYVSKLCSWTRLADAGPAEEPPAAPAQTDAPEPSGAVEVVQLDVAVDVLVADIAEPVVHPLADDTGDAATAAEGAEADVADPGEAVVLPLVDDLSGGVLVTLQRSQGELRPAVAPPDEQPFAEPGVAAPLVRRVSGGRVADSAAARVLAKMPRRGRFVPRHIACDPRFEVHNRRRLDWLRKRRTELATMTGGVSYAVGAMLAAAAWLYAAGEFAAELGAETGDVDAFKSAATLTATARTHDFGAWELATREAAARPRGPVDPMARIRAMAEGGKP